MDLSTCTCAARATTPATVRRPVLLYPAFCTRYHHLLLLHPISPGPSTTEHAAAAVCHPQSLPPTPTPSSLPSRPSIPRGQRLCHRHCCYDHDQRSRQSTTTAPNNTEHHTVHPRLLPAPIYRYPSSQLINQTPPFALHTARCRFIYPGYTHIGGFQ